MSFGENISPSSCSIDEDENSIQNENKELTDSDGSF